MNRHYRYGLGALAAVVILGGAAAFLSGRFFASADSPTGDSAAYTAFANSANHVKASFVQAGEDGVITLHIAPHWHVNAHPASLENLIASTVFIEHDGTQHAVQADYPAGKRSGITIDNTNILVYEDDTRIPVHQLKLAAGDRLVVRVQACNDQGICLAPATISVAEKKT